MPINRHDKIRILIKEKMVKVVNSKPFTIQLFHDTTGYTQNVNLGIDSGYLNICYSALAEKKELISGDVKLFNGIPKRFKEKDMY